MKKIGIAVVLAGLFVVGCGDSGLVKLENKNPTIDQKKYDLYVQKLQESEIKGAGVRKTIKTSEYDFYHSDSESKYAPIKEKCKEKNIPDILCNARIGDQNKLKENGKYFVVFSVNKKNPKEFYRILLKCEAECKTIDNVVVKDISEII
ncbi:hypothetical protein [Helicobacter sp. UBA3407]|nr:hypothetical protein [Helicobacter sp. UBA3407]